MWHFMWNVIYIFNALVSPLHFSDCQEVVDEEAIDKEKQLIYYY